MTLLQPRMLGLWGTANPTRVAVTLEYDRPETIIGYVRARGGLDQWIAEGDRANRVFDTPRHAAEYGYSVIWRKSVS